MNKKLMALAVAGACVAPSVMAQTANPVTLYGRVHLTLESVEVKGGTTPLPSRVRVADQASLLGVRGTEDLGGGLKAFFQLETGFAPDQASTNFATRNSGVGLQGSWGSVLLGRWDTPFKSATTNIDPYGDVTIGGTTAAMNDRGNFDRREANTIQYWSPKMGGFDFKLMWAANEGKTATVNPQSTSTSLTYSQGPVYAFITYEEHKDNNALVATTGLTGVAGYKEKGTAGGGTFRMGNFRIGGMYEEFKKTNLSTQKAWMANLVYTMGKHQFSYQHQNAKNGAANTAALQPKCDVDTVGWQYNFSRRTFVLAMYSKTDNNDASSCRFGGNSLAQAAGQDPQGYSFSVRHVF